MGKFTAIAKYLVFENLWNSNKVDLKAINFILDTGQIYTHGIFINSAAYGAATDDAVELTIAGTKKALSLSSHTHSDYLLKNSNIDIGSYKIISGSKDLLYYSLGSTYLGDSESPLVLNASGITAYKDGTSYDVLDTENFSIENSLNRATFKYGSRTFYLDYVRRLNANSTFDDLASYTSAGTTRVNNILYGFITLRTDATVNNPGWAQLRINISGKSIQFRTSAESNKWYNISLSEVNNNALNVAGIVAAPTSNTKNKVWKTDDEGNPGWRDEAISTNSWRNIRINDDTEDKLGSNANTGALYIKEGPGISVLWINNKVVISNTSLSIWKPANSTQEGYVPQTLLAVKILKSKTDGTLEWADETTYSFEDLKFLKVLGTDIFSYNSQVSKTILAGDNIDFTLLNDNLVISSQNTWILFVGASAISDGTSGYVPRPGSGNLTKFFRGDGSWVTITLNVDSALYIGASNGTSTSALLQDPYIIFKEGSSYLRYKLYGLNGITVSSDLYGNILLTGTTYLNVSKQSSGLVPALPNEDTTTKFLRQDGTWQVPSYTQLPTFYNLIFNNGSSDVLTYDPDGSASNTIKAGSNVTFSVSSNILTISALDTWTAWKGATSSNNGTAGYMPAPGTANYQKFLRGDGTWCELNNYSLPKATTSALGGIIASNALTTAVTLTSSNGNTTDRYYGVQVDKDGKAFVNVPWTSGSDLTAATASNLGGVKIGTTLSDTSEYTKVHIDNSGFIYYKDTNTIYTFYNLAFNNGTSDIDTYKPSTSPSKTLKAGSNISFSASSNVITVSATNTWQANSKDNDGYVTKGTGKASCVWMTDANGNPSWQVANNHTHNYLETVASVSGSTHAVALQTLFINNKASIPRNKLINYYSSAYGNGSLCFGYFLNGYDSNPYGGFYVCHYDTPYYVGISNGTFTLWELSKVGHTHDYLPLNGGTITGNLILKGSTSSEMTYSGNVHPALRFDNPDSSQNVSFIFTDYDNYRSPAGIKLVGNQGSEWFEAPLIYQNGTKVSVEGHSHTFASITNKVVHTNEFNFMDSEYSTIWLNYRRSSDTAATTLTTDFYFGRGNASSAAYASLNAEGFKKRGSSSAYVLLGDGGHKALTDFVLSDHNHDGRYLRYEGWWTDGNGNNANNANGMVFAYKNHNVPGPSWGILTTFDYQYNSAYKMQLFSDGWANGYTYYRNRSSDRGGWNDWVRFLDATNYTEYVYDKTTSDGRYVAKGGDTMSGSLTMTGNADIAIRMNTNSSNAKDFSWQNTSGTTIACIEYHNTAQGLILNSIGASSVWNDSLGKYSLYIGNNKLTYNTYNIIHEGNYSTYLDGKYLPTSGGTMTGNISYKGTKATYEMIKFIDNTSDTYGNGIAIGGGGLTIIGGGESASAAASAIANGSSEQMVICNDGSIEFYSNMLNGWGSRKGFTMSTDGEMYVGSYKVWHAGNLTPVKHIEYGSGSIDAQSGSFFFGGDNYYASGYDYVGLLAGNSVDKWQLIVVDSLKWRLNDSGGTNASWGSWRTLVDSVNMGDFLPSFAYKAVSPGTATVLSDLDTTKTFIYATISANVASTAFKLHSEMNVGQVLTILVYNSTTSTKTITIPTTWSNLSGSAVASLDGFNLSCGGLKFIEISILCYASKKYLISTKGQ